MASKKKVKIADLPKPMEELTSKKAKAVRGGFAPGGGGKKQTRYDPSEPDPTPTPTPTPSPTPTPTPR